MTLDPKAREAARAVFIASWGYSPDDFLDKAITAYLAALASSPLVVPSASPSPPALDGAGRAAALDEAATWLEEQAEADFAVAEDMPEYSPEGYRLMLRSKWRKADAAAIRALKETR